MSIFEKSNHIGIPEFDIIRKNKNYYILKNGWTFDMSPPLIAKINLPPNVKGVDSFISEGQKIKNIKGDRLKLLVNKEWFLECDVKVEYFKKEFDGWIYKIKSESMQINSIIDIWVCSYLKNFFKETPNQLYLKLEKG